MVQRLHRLPADRCAVPRGARRSQHAQSEVEILTAFTLTEPLAGPDRTVTFDRQGRQRSARDLAAAAEGVAALVRNADGERWALNLDDGFEFTAALLGCWAAGRVPVLAPRQLLASLERSVFDGVIESARDSTQAAYRVAFEDVVPVRRPLRAIDATAALVLYTSGSTGEPKAAGRRLTNIDRELATLESLWGSDLGGARVFSTVSHRHVYGLLFRVLWPLKHRRPFASFDYEYPEQLLGEIGRGNALVASPAMLKRVGHLPAGAGRWSAVFSSGGALPPTAVEDVRRVLGVDATEIYGSTETSGVAWRRGSGAKFRVLPPVEITASGELLEVRSPFAGCDDWQTMGDRVAIAADGTLELLGRADRVAKIEDKRVSLSEVERHLLAHAFVNDTVALVLERNGRQYVAVVVELSDRGREAFEARGVRAVNFALRGALRGRVDPLAVPRFYRYPRQIPADAQGKRSVGALRELFERKP